MNERLLSFLGIARRAGRLSLGYDSTVEAMTKGSSCLVLLAADLSERTKHSINTAAQGTNTPLIETNIPMEQLGAAVGKATGIISVNDSGFARKLNALCKE